MPHHDPTRQIMYEPERVPQFPLCRIALLPQPAHVVAFVPIDPPPHSPLQLLILSLKLLKPSLHPRLALFKRAYTHPELPLCVAGPLHGVREPVLQVCNATCGLCELLVHDGFMRDVSLTVHPGYGYGHQCAYLVL